MIIRSILFVNRHGLSGGTQSIDCYQHGIAKRDNACYVRSQGYSYVGQSGKHEPINKRLLLRLSRAAETGKWGKEGESFSTDDFSRVE